MSISELYQLFLQFPIVQTDSRRVKKGDLFFALKGPTFNGNEFAQQAIEQGAAYAIIDEDKGAFPNECFIMVDNVLQTLQELASFHRKQFSIPIIAITGSNGKTTSKELLTIVLSQKYKTYATEGNLNNHIGVPLSILKVKKDAEMVIIEMGANHQQEIASYCQIAMPNYGIVTNCGKAHIDGFGGIEGVRKGKGELFDYIRGNEGVIFLNNDLDYLNPMSLGIMNIITYGVTAHADYTIVQKADESMTLSVVASNKDETISIHSNLVGEYNLPNIALAFAVGAYFKVPLQNIKNAIEHYHPDNSRSQLIKTASNQVILDAYNANPTSMRAAIHNFSKLPGEKFLWLGAMKEMGEEEPNEHRDLVSFIKQWHWAQVVLVGLEFRPHAGEFPWFLDSSLAAEFVEKQKPQNTLILIKGSRGSKMEKLFDAIKAI